MVGKVKQKKQPQHMQAFQTLDVFNDKCLTLPTTQVWKAAEGSVFLGCVSIGIKQHLETKVSLNSIQHMQCKERNTIINFL